MLLHVFYGQRHERYGSNVRRGPAGYSALVGMLPVIHRRFSASAVLRLFLVDYSLLYRTITDPAVATRSHCFCEFVQAMVDDVSPKEVLYNQGPQEAETNYTPLLQDEQIT